MTIINNFLGELFIALGSANLTVLILIFRELVNIRDTTKNHDRTLYGNDDVDGDNGVVGEVRETRDMVKEIYKKEVKE